jgi:WD40 repeat protein
VLSLALHPDNVTLISGGRDGTVRVWDTASPGISGDATTTPAQLVTWQFAADGKSIITLNRDGVVAEWKGVGFRDPVTLFTVSDFTPVLQGAPVSNYYGRFSVGARLLAVGSLNGSIQIWDIERRQLQREIKGVASDVLPVEFLEHNTRLLVCERIQSNFREYDLQTGRDVAVWPGPTDTYRFGAGVSPDNTFVIAIGTGGNAILRNRRTGQVKNSDLVVSWAEAPVFSADGRLFTSGAQRSSPKIWETSSLREVAELPASVEVNSVAFSPDGTRLASGSSGVEAMKIWDLASHQPLLTLPAEGSLFRPVQFSPDGNMVGAISLGGILHLWRAPSWEEIEAVEKAQTAKTPMP